VKHENPQEKATYDLRGSERKEVKEKILHRSAHSIQREMLKDANLDALKSGNYAFVRNLNVLRTAKYEVI
jgi:hypothetical protein